MWRRAVCDRSRKIIVTHFLSSYRCQPLPLSATPQPHSQPNVARRSCMNFAASSAAVRRRSATAALCALAGPPGAFQGHCHAAPPSPGAPSRFTSAVCPSCTPGAPAPPAHARCQVDQTQGDAGGAAPRCPPAYKTRFALSQARMAQVLQYPASSPADRPCPGTGGKKMPIQDRATIAGNAVPARPLHAQVMAPCTHSCSGYMRTCLLESF